jgi:hypothetical protein
LALPTDQLGSCFAGTGLFLGWLNHYQDRQLISGLVTTINGQYSRAPQVFSAGTVPVTTLA